MFTSLYNCCPNSSGSTVADYHGDGVYNTFVFINGECLEWNDDFDRIQQLQENAQ